MVGPGDDRRHPRLLSSLPARVFLKAGFRAKVGADGEKIYAVTDETNSDRLRD